jgi:hypothetical protein
VVFKMDTPCYSCEPGTEFEIPLRWMSCSKAANFIYTIKTPRNTVPFMTSGLIPWRTPITVINRVVRFSCCLQWTGLLS